MKIQKSMLFAAMILVSVAACTKSNGDNKDGSVSTAQMSPAQQNPTNNVAPEPGTPLYTFHVSGKQLSVDGVPVEEIDDETFAGYPVLAARVAEASGADRVVVTTENTLELYIGAELIMVIAVPEVGAPVIIYTRNGFVADSIEYTYTASDQDQGLASGMLTFNLSECVDDGQQEQGEKDQGDKGQGEVCKVAVVSLELMEHASPKDPGQGQECDKDQKQCDDGEQK
jgi:hypothetical protein